jgi:hypothetical protein
MQMFLRLKLANNVWAALRHLMDLGKRFCGVSDSGNYKA